jgi:hypothetical protein
VNGEALASLFATMAHSPNLSGAVCVDPAVRAVFDRAADVRVAGAVAEAAWACTLCPALAACRAWVEGLPHGQRPRGVVGGLVITDRSSALRGVPLPSG